jgi:endo-1,4-beta-xylanase
MKWDAIEATKGVFTFDTADQTAAFASENGKMLPAPHLGPEHHRQG